MGVQPNPSSQQERGTGETLLSLHWATVSTKMSGRNRSISLNCSLTTPATLTTGTPNTPEILNAIINISSHHLEKITANEIQLKKEKTFQASDASFGFNDINDGGAKLTFEDEERRLRRRERNKVAATKCRNKKKERTTRLIAEGEVLQIQNTALKEELRKLEAEARSLTDLLSQHSKVCAQKRKLESDKSECRGAQDPHRKQRKVEHQRAHLDLPDRCNRSEYENNMEAFQTNYYHGPEVSIKSEEDPSNNFYGGRGYFQQFATSGYSMLENQSFCLPSYGI